MRIGIYGGSFNPPHLGHTHAAEKAVERLGLDRLLVVPAGLPPHKSLPAGSPDEKSRMEMTKIAFSGISCASVEDFEIVNGGMSYTVNTLRHFKKLFPEDDLYLLMGTDMYLTLDAWHESGDILSLAVPVVFARKDGEYGAIREKAAELSAKYGAKAQIVTLDAYEAASSQIREMLKNGGGRELLDKNVYAYIIKRRLYGALPELEWLREESYSYHKAKRIPHVKGCEATAAYLAEKWGADVESAREAGILHDITKKLGLGEQLILCGEYGILIDDLERKSEKLLHSKTGAAFARDFYGISDEVYEAIRWHTTGKADMTTLEKVLYMADYIEPTRRFDGVEELRRLCDEDLDRAMALGLEMSVEELEEKGVTVHPKTLEALEFYKK